MEEKKICKKIDLHKYKIPPRILFLEKLNANSHKKIIKSKISEYFLSPEKYFEQNSNIMINKKIIIKKISSFGNLGQSVKSNMTKPSYNRERIISNSNYNKSNRETTNEKEFINKNFETINNERLRDIFNSYKNNRLILKKNLLKNHNHNSYDSNIPLQLSIDLDSQLRLLNQNTKAESKSRQMSKYLSRKIKKNEKTLLINNIYSYHNKKQILNNNLSNNSKYNNVEGYLFKWVSSLRRPKNFNGKIKSYINVGNQDNPLWSTAIEKYPDDKEITVKAGNDLEKKDNKNDNDKNDQFKSVDDLERINIRGKKLYDIEYNREMSSNCSKVLHKSLVDNGKVIMYKDVNNIFGYETIYKNYLGRNKKNNKNYILSKSKSMQSINLNNNESKY
jgi:hypothetical protein